MELPSLQRAVFNRMFRGKTAIPYRLRISGDQYIIQVVLKWKWAFFKAFIERFRKETKSKTEVPDIFKADTKAYGHILKELKPTMEKVIREEAKKGMKLKILSARVQEAVFARKGEEITLSVAISGLCEASQGG